MATLSKILGCSLIIGSSMAAHSDVNFNGFASIYGGMTLEEGDTLYGYDDEISYKSETLFGLQMTSALSDNLTATGQLIGRSSDNYGASFEWAYATYSFNDAASLSFGRLRLPLFKYSEYLDVGYAYPWARTPRDVYDVDFNTMEGLRFNYDTQVGPLDTNFQIVRGSFQENIEVDGNDIPFRFNGITGFSVDATYDWISVRAGYTMAEINAEIDLSGLATFFTPSALDELAIDEDYGYFSNFGVFIDYDGWLLNAELVEYDTEDSLLAKNSRNYAMLGKRMGAYTLAITMGQSVVEQDFSVLAGLPDALQTAVKGQMLKESDRTSQTVTFRYDFEPGAALKIEYTTEEYTLFDNLDSDRSNSLVTAGIDLVF